jgi:hypothetical protein
MLLPQTDSWFLQYFVGCAVLCCFPPAIYEGTVRGCGVLDLGDVEINGQRAEVL